MFAAVGDTGMPVESGGNRGGLLGYVQTFGSRDEGSIWCNRGNWYVGRQQWNLVNGVWWGCNPLKWKGGSNKMLGMI